MNIQTISPLTYLIYRLIFARIPIDFHAIVKEIVAIIVFNQPFLSLINPSHFYFNQSPSKDDHSKLTSVSNSSSNSTFSNVSREELEAKIASSDQATITKFMIFLRRAALVEHFILGKTLFDDSKKDIVDWDDILENANLCKHFNITYQEVKYQIVFPPFELMKLPENYLGFVLPPYNYRFITDLENETALCLVTNQIVRLSSNGNQSLMSMNQYLKEKCQEATSIFLILSGPQASSIFFGSYDFKIKLKTKEIYLDSYGDSDIGFKRGEILELDQEKKERLVEQFLDGSWTNLLVN